MTLIVVTGAAGFIGSCVLARLNDLGLEDIIAVDHLNDELKKKNLENKRIVQYYEKDDFLKCVVNDSINQPIDAVIHMGACSSTTLTDEQYYNHNNYEYSRYLAKWSLKKGARFIYASSAATYGDGSHGYKDDDASTLQCQPLNLYGESKQKFDRWVLENDLINQVVGLKFFNVFGPNEYHKKDMRSVVCKAYPKVDSVGEMVLFKSYHKDYSDGEQKRDFIYIKDAVDVVMYFFDNDKVNGIFNVGTGQARTWNDLANALFMASGKKTNIKYIEMPENLRSKYQYFTQADMDKLKQSGYDKEFTNLEDAVSDYVTYLKEQIHI